MSALINNLIFLFFFLIENLLYTHSKVCSFTKHNRINIDLNYIIIERIFFSSNADLFYILNFKLIFIFYCFIFLKIIKHKIYKKSK